MRSTICGLSSPLVGVIAVVAILGFVVLGWLIVSPVGSRNATATYAAGPVPKTVAEKIVDRMYDARKAGLKTLSFRIKVEGGSKPGGMGIAAATVYWQAPDQLNIVPEDASGKRVQLHPYFLWVLGRMYVTACLPMGISHPQLGTLNNATAKPVGETGYQVTSTHPTVLDGKSTGRSIRTVYDCDKNFAITRAAMYGVMGAGAPPEGKAHQTMRYQIVADGRSLLAEQVRYGRGKGKNDRRENGRLTITYDKINGFWLPKESVQTEMFQQGAKTVRFSDYKVNPDLPASAIAAAEWPKAKLDLSTPDKTLRSLYDALYLGDLDAIGSCLSKPKRKTFDDELAKVRRMHQVPADAKGTRPDWKIMWGGFIHGNAGTTSEIRLADEQQTDTTFSARLTTVTTGRPVDLRIRLVKESGKWKVDNSPEELMKGYD